MTGEITEEQRERYARALWEETRRTEEINNSWDEIDDEDHQLLALEATAVALAARKDLIAEMSTAAMVEAGGEIMDHGDTPEYRHLYRVSCWIRDYTPEPADPDTSDGGE